MLVVHAVAQTDIDRFTQLAVKKGIPWQRLQQNGEDAKCVLLIATLFCPHSSYEEVEKFLVGPASWLQVGKDEFLKDLNQYREQPYTEKTPPSHSMGVEDVERYLALFHKQRMASQQAIRKQLQEKNQRLHAKGGTNTISTPLQDTKRMELALDCARQALAAGEVPVGAILVREGKILALAQNRVCRDKDPTAHAEILAIREACKKTNSERIPQTVLYVTLEPCPMCAAAIAAARIGKVIWGADNPLSGGMGGTIDLARSAHLNHRASVQGGVLGDEAKELLLSFFRGKRKKL